MHNHLSRTTCWALAIAAGLPAWAMAQDLPAESLGGGSQPIEWAILAAKIVGAGLVVAALAMAGWLLVWSQRRPPELEGIYLEPSVVGSKFEQLLAEIQGLTLRVQGGERKGYYHKIEQLVRVFLERTGHPGARQMPDTEIDRVLHAGDFPAEVATQLFKIFQMCKKGEQHESENLDFSAADLLRELRIIVKQVEGVPTRR